MELEGKFVHVQSFHQPDSITQNRATETVCLIGGMSCDATSVCLFVCHTYRCEHKLIKQWLQTERGRRLNIYAAGNSYITLGFQEACVKVKHHSKIYTVPEKRVRQRISTNNQNAKTARKYTKLKILCLDTACFCRHVVISVQCCGYNSVKRNIRTLYEGKEIIPTVYKMCPRQSYGLPKYKAQRKDNKLR